MTNAERLRARLLLLLALPACKEAPPPDAPATINVPVASSSSMVPEPEPVPSATAAGRKKTCASDEAFEHLCGKVRTPGPCPPTARELAMMVDTFGPSDLNGYPGAPVLDSFTADPSIEPPAAAQCCYSRCERLVTMPSRGTQMPAGYVDHPFSIPAAPNGTTLSAPDHPECAAGLVRDNFFGRRAEASFKDVMKDHKGRELCRYVVPTMKPKPCPPGQQWNTRTDQCQVQYVKGRPVRVEGIARFAATTRSNAWSERESIEDVPLDPEAAAVWEAHAAAEHSSVAAFAKLALDLLALGAPPELVADAHVAAGQEIRHAQLSYAVASALAGEPRGPGPLAVDGRGPVDLAVLVRETLLDGCIGETAAALEASELRAWTHGSIRDVLEIIAHDETEHAAHAFRIVKWALRRDPALAAIVRDVLDEAVVEASATIDPGPRAALGIARREASAAFRAVAIRDVVAPCLRALLDYSSSASSSAFVMPPA